MPDDSYEFDKDAFVARLATDEAMSDRWSGIVDVVVQQGRSMGIEIDSEDVISIPTARLALLTEMPLEGERYDAEFLAMPSVQRAHETAQMVEALRESKAEAQDVLDRMSSADKLNFARKHNLMGGGNSDRHATAQTQAERLEIIQSIRSPSERISLARKWNLTGG